MKPVQSNRDVLVGAAVGALAGLLFWWMKQSSEDEAALPAVGTKPGGTTSGGTKPGDTAGGGKTPALPTGTGPSTTNCGLPTVQSSQPPGQPASCPVFPSNLQARNEYILDKVKRGEFYVDWVPITSTIGGNTATFFVTGDALKVDGVRVTVDAKTEQKIADALGANLLTPKLADLIFLQSDIRIAPISQQAWVQSGTMATTPHMIEQSQAVDRAIEAAAGSLDAAKNKIVSTVGKHWVVTNELMRAKPGRAQNYGWHMVGSGGEAAVTNSIDPKTGKPLRVIQGPWMAHDFMHTDYSQNVVLVANKALLNGNTVDLETILKDPKLAALASHQGPLVSLRQPGVEQIA